MVVGALLGATALVLAYQKTEQYTGRYKLKAAIYASEYGDPRAAVALLQELRDELPDEALAVSYNLGATYYEIGSLPEAQRWLTTALEHDPRHLASLLLDARVLLEMGRDDEGVAALTRAATVSPQGRQTVREIVDVLAASGNAALAQRLRAALAAAAPPD